VNEKTDVNFSILGDNDGAIAGIIREFNFRVKLATLYYADNSQSSNHSKVYIIDEDCFYVGSDNMYPSAHREGLQEFGYLIEDEKETQKFKAEYWDQLWGYSEKHALN
jgi:phosphatidylserine/phosphatidylglycerophosphate/cardiolipin synthase-like enzyme